MGDVIVIGAGIIGAACARALTATGLTVTVVDRGGSAGGTSAACEGNLLVSDKGPGPELVLAQYAAARWPQVAAELADELGPAFPSIEYETKGGIVVAASQPGLEALLTFARTQSTAGITAHPLTPAEARTLEPDLNPALTGAVHYPEDAQVQPTVTAEAFLASARRRGAQVRTGSEVLSALTGVDDHIVGVRTTTGPLYADIVVVAAGPWSGEVSTRLVTNPMAQRIFHKVYDGDYVGATQSGDAGLQTSSVIESTAGGTVLIGSSRQQIGFDDALTVEVLRQLAAKAVSIFPFLAGVPVLRAYGGFRPYLPDHLPVVGPDPGVAGLWHASGHEGAGIGLSVATADLLTAQLLGHAAGVDPAPFQPSRPSLQAHLVAA
jgi:glycine/D-amino acid oxidase-like deaminating enzyme